MATMLIKNKYENLLTSVDVCNQHLNIETSEDTKNILIDNFYDETHRLTIPTTQYLNFCYLYSYGIETIEQPVLNFTKKEKVYNNKKYFNVTNRKSYIGAKHYTQKISNVCRRKI
jgi:hypothetical protein